MEQVNDIITAGRLAGLLHDYKISGWRQGRAGRAGTRPGREVLELVPVSGVRAWNRLASVIRSVVDRAGSRASPGTDARVLVTFVVNVL